MHGKGGAGHGMGPYEVQPCPQSKDQGILQPELMNLDLGPSK